MRIIIPKTDFRAKEQELFPSLRIELSGYRNINIIDDFEDIIVPDLRLWYNELDENIDQDIRVLHILHDLIPNDIKTMHEETIKTEEELKAVDSTPEPLIPDFGVIIMGKIFKFKVEHIKMIKDCLDFKYRNLSSNKPVPGKEQETRDQLAILEEIAEDFDDHTIHLFPENYTPHQLWIANIEHPSIDSFAELLFKAHVEADRAGEAKLATAFPRLFDVAIKDWKGRKDIN